MAITTRFASAAGLLAALSLAATPVSAAELPTDVSRSSLAAAGAWDSDGENANQYRYRGYRRNRVDAGDIIGGIVVIGTIAAIASAASRASQDRRYGDYRYRDYRYRDRPYDYRSYRGDNRYNNDGRGIDRAVDMCVDRVERDARVDRVNSVERVAEGWRVTGSLYNGDGFSCRIGNNGRIEDIDYGRGFATDDRGYDRRYDDDRQYDDDRYARAWQNQGGAALPPPPADKPGQYEYEYAEDSGRDYGGD